MEDLADLRLAIDASIWLQHFLKAQRGPDGTPIPGAHLLGFFRRICKLLYYGIRPVFVFDGPAPELKRRTLAKRRERREGTKVTVDHARLARKILASQLDKAGKTMTTEMIRETRELLSYFNIPYVDAPSEAEAQCVELERLGLVDGVVTDDGDALLFGAQRLYRNVFRKDKYVELYQASVLSRDLFLDRDHLIAAGLLLGGDYADGVVGIGPALAKDMLKVWRNSCGHGGTEGPMDYLSRLRHILEDPKEDERGLDPSFPDPRVVQAYTDPMVDHSTEKCVWLIPDLDGLER
ncbi:MAG: PIN domain-like protein [Piptocephalis tieghemiana]|nr:MAG: PIN domain-like protein [Piptocephalis tieghemiana]